MPAAKQDSHPKKEFSAILQNGLTAHALATKHQPELEPRLPNGCLVALAADLSILGAHVPGAKEAHATAQAATVSQDAALASGHALVTAIRTAVARSGASLDVQKAYGVGVKVSPKVVKDVKLAIGLILKRAAAEPAEAKDVGILPKDVTALNAAAAAITDADDAQEKQRAAAPLSTKERNATARRILAAVDRIVGAGVIEFAQNPTLRAQFEALIGKGNPEAKPKGKGSGEKPNEG